MRSASFSARSCEDSTSGTEVYFIAAPGRIKIGISRRVRQRVVDIGSHMETGPELLGHIKGSYGFEKHLHGLLSAHRIKGEWFSDCPDVRDVMSRVLAGDQLGFVPARKSVPDVAYETREYSPEEQLATVVALASLVFPGDPAGGLAEKLDYSRDLISDYLTGRAPIPVLVSYAFAAVVIEYATSNLKKRSDSKR